MKIIKTTIVKLNGARYKNDKCTGIPLSGGGMGGSPPAPPKTK